MPMSCFGMAMSTCRFFVPLRVIAFLMMLGGRAV